MTLKTKTAKFVAGFVGFALALSFVVTPVTSSAQTAAELQAMINTLLAQIAALQGQVGGSTPAGHTFTTDLTVGSTGAEVTALQTWLVSKGFLTMPAGVAMGTFGPLTQSAVAAYQTSKGISPASGYFGPMTRASVNAMTPAPTPPGTPGGTTGTPGSLSGGAGDITVTERNSGTEDEVLEGEEGVAVLGFEVEADGGDVAITSVRVEFKRTGSGGSTRLERYVDEVQIMQGNKVVGTADAGDFSKSGTTYSRNISVQNATVREDGKARFFVAVSAIGNIDSNDIEKDWLVGVGQIRFNDATGAILTDTTGTGVTSDVIRETISFTDLASSGNVELKIDEDNNSVNESQTVIVDDSSDTNNVDVLSFTLEADSSDIYLNTLSFGVTSNSGTGVTEIANDFRLMMGADEVGTVTIDKDCGGGSDGFASTIDEAICVVVSELDNDDVVIESGDEVSFMLVADINDVDGGFSSGDTLSVTFNGDVTLDISGHVDAEDQNGDALTVSELSGSANSTNVKFLSSGVSVTTVSTTHSVDTKVSDVATDDQGIFEIVFDVTAIEDTAFVELGSATRGESESNTGANFIIQDEPNAYAATSTGSIALADLTRVSGGSVSGEFVRINAGQTARLKLVVTFDPGHVTGSSVGYRMRLYSVNSAATAIDATAQRVLTPEVDYRTGSRSVGN